MVGTTEVDRIPPAPLSRFEKPNPVPLTDQKFREVLDLYEGGMSLSAICREPEMPSYSNLLRMIAKRADFWKAVEEARKVRALHFEEKARESIETIRDMDDKDRTAVARLEFDGFMRFAEISHPEKYGKKSTISGDPDRPIQIVVSTGVPAPLEHQKPPELAVDGTVVTFAREEEADTSTGKFEGEIPWEIS